MRWSHRNTMIGASTAAAAIGLVASLVVVLADRGAPPRRPRRGAQPSCIPRLPPSR
jgi:hypothetical protein